MKFLVLLVSLCAFATIVFAADPKIETLALGAAAPDFKLPGVDGRDWALNDFQDAKVLVVVFTCVHCPTAQAYEERLKKIVSDYQDKGVAVVAISPNDPKSVRLDELGYTDLGDSFEDMKLRAKDKAFNFPFLYDGENEAVSRAYGPTATPHAFVFDAARKLRYVGRIDDAERESLLKVSDLRNAIDALLNGGTSFRIQLVSEPDEKGEKKEITKTMVDQAAEVIRKRVGKLGTSEPIITPAGTDGILVQIPGLSAEKLESARQQLKQVARLEFRMVHPNGEQILADLAAPDPDYKVETYKDERKGKPFEEQLLVKKTAGIPGSMVTAAHAVYDQRGWGVSLHFNKQGAELFGRLTAANVGKRFAIVLDGVVQSAPVINQAIYGGSASISGNFKEQQARDLASVLENPLATPVMIVEERSASASLGTTRAFGCSIKWAGKEDQVKAWLAKADQEPVNVELVDAAGLKALRAGEGSKVRLVNFWATWCGPCVAEFPDLVEIFRMYRQRDFEFVTVSANYPDEKSEVLKFLTKQHASMKNLLWNSTDKNALMEAFEPKWAGQLPFTMLLGPKGEVLFQKDGAVDALELKRAIVQALGREKLK